MDKKFKIETLKNRYNIIISRGKTAEDQGVLRKIKRKIRNLEKEIDV